MHGWEHRYLTLRGPRATRDDIARAADAIAAATGTMPRLYRPPYGVLTGGALVAARQLGLTPGAVEQLGPGMVTRGDAGVGLR